MKYQLEEFYIHNYMYMAEFDKVKSKVDQGAGHNLQGENGDDVDKSGKANNENKIQINNVYFDTNRRILSSKIFSILEIFIKQTNISFFVYYLLVFVETLQILLLLLLYADPTTENSNESFKLSTFLNKNFTPYITFYKFFTFDLFSFYTYFSICIAHISLQIFILIVLFLMTFPKIRANFLVKIFVKISVHKIILSLSFLIINEMFLNLTVFKCVSENYETTNELGETISSSHYVHSLFTGIECYTNRDYHLPAVIINILSMIINVVSVLFFGIMFNDFSFYFAKLPWSSPYNNLPIYLNLFKIKLVVVNLFIEGISAETKILLGFIFFAIFIYERYMCPFYFHSSVTKAKIFSEGFMISFGVLLFMYLILNSSISNIAFTDPNYLDLIFLFITPICCGILYVFLILFFTKRKIISFSNTLKVKDYSFFDIYICLIKLKDLIYHSKADVDASNFLLTFYSTHCKNCHDVQCFCLEIEYLLKNKELQFKKNSHGFDDNMHFPNDSNILIRGEDLNCLDIEDADREEIENNIDNLEIEKRNFMQRSKVGNMADKNVKYNKIWGKFLKELILKYVRLIGGYYIADRGGSCGGRIEGSDYGYKGGNNENRNCQSNSKNKFAGLKIPTSSSSSFYSLNVEPSSERNSRFSTDSTFPLIKIEFANLIMFFLRNPMYALREICLIDHTKLDFVSKFILFLTEKRILKECKDFFFKSEMNDRHLNDLDSDNPGISSKNIHGNSSSHSYINLCEMKSILKYNMLWNKLLLQIRKNIINTEKLWGMLMKRHLFPKKIEKTLQVINQEMMEISTQFKEIEQINMKSAELDYKIFKIYGHYLNKIWKWEDEAVVYIKKAYNEMVLGNSKEKINMSNNDENLINPNLFNFLVDGGGTGTNQNLNNTNNVNRGTNQNAYDVFKLNDTGIVIINGDYYDNQDEDLGKIIYSNEHLARNICNYDEVEELVGKNVTSLMPEFLSAIHRHHIIQFYFTSHQKIINHVRPLFLLDKNKYFVPIKINIKILPGINRGIHFISYITKEDYSQAGKLKNSKIGYLLTDSNNKILHFDKNAKRKLGLSSKMIFNITQSEDEAMRLQVLFPELINNSKIEELKKSMGNLVFNPKGIASYFSEMDNEDNIARNILNINEDNGAQSGRTSLNFHSKSKFTKNKLLRQTIKSPNPGSIVLSPKTSVKLSRGNSRKKNKNDQGNPLKINLNGINNENSFNVVNKKKTYKMGAIDHRTKNPLLDLSESILKTRSYLGNRKPKNDGYLIYYIIFEKEKNDKIPLADLIRLKEEQLEKTESANKLVDDIGSVASNNFTNQFSNIQVLISSIKSSLHKKQSPGVLKFVNFLFFSLVLLLGGIVALQSAFIFLNDKEISNLITLAGYLYQQKAYMHALTHKTRSWQLMKVGVLDPFALDLDYFDKQIDQELLIYINEISNIQSQINTFDKDAQVDSSVSDIVHKDEISLRSYNEQLTYSESPDTLPNAVVKFIMQVKSYTNDWTSVNESYKDFVFVNPDVIDQDFIQNLIDSNPDAYLLIHFMKDSFNIFQNFEKNFNPFYTRYFTLLTENIVDLTTTQESILYYLFIASVVVNFIFYFLIFLFLYLLSRKIYSVMFELVKIPYPILDKCYSDSLDCERTLTQIIYDDETFLMINLDFILSDKMNANERKSFSEGVKHDRAEKATKKNLIEIKGSKIEKDSRFGSGLNPGLSYNVDTQTNLLNSHALDTDAPVNTVVFMGEKEEKIETPEKSSNVIQELINEKMQDKSRHPYSLTRILPENRLDDRFMKYDERNVNLQNKTINFYIFKQSLSWILLIYIFFFNCMFIFDYFYVDKKLVNFSTVSDIYLDFNDLHYSLPELFTAFREGVIMNEIDLEEFDKLSNSSQWSLQKIDRFFRNENNAQSFSSLDALFQYFQSLNFVNSSSFCNFYQTRMKSSILYTNTSDESFNLICNRTMSFKNGFELGTYNSLEMIKKISSNIYHEKSINGKINIPLEQKIQYISDRNFNKYFSNIFDIFNPLLQDFASEYSNNLMSLLENIKTYSYIRAIISIILFIIILILYIYNIHSIYYNKFIYNKTMLLLIPIEYLKKQKDLITNYV